MNKLVIGAIVVILIIALAVFVLIYKPYKPTIKPTAAAVEGAAINAVEQEMEQAIANITEQDIEAALTQ